MSNRSFAPLLTLALTTGLAAAPLVWDNSNATGQWSTPANWVTNTEPTAADDLTFPAVIPGSATITLSAGENARTLLFQNAYTLTGGGLTLAAAPTLGVATGVSAIINTPVTMTGGAAKTGDGTLTLGGANPITGGLLVSAGRLRAANASALGTVAGSVTTVAGGATLEITTGVTVDRPITLQQGATLAGSGTGTSNGVHTVEAGATAVTLSTVAASDAFTLGNAANDLTGGSAATVVTLSGPGSVRLGAASNFNGSWLLASGRLDLLNANALGQNAAATVTLAGGTLAGRMAAAAAFTTSPGNQLLLTASSALLSDRSSASAGVAYTFGTLSLGTHTLTVAPGPNATSGTATIVVGEVALTGDPTFAVNDLGSANGRLQTGSWNGGASPRLVTKTGDGDLSVTGGTTSLVAGSQVNVSGQGIVEALFPALGAGASITPTAAQHPFGAATFNFTAGLRLLADGDGTAAAQTFVLGHPFSLAGSTFIETDRRATGSNKTFQLGDLSLAAGTVLSFNAANGYRVAAGTVTLAGDATIQGTTSRTTNVTLGALTETAAGTLTLGGPATHTLTLTTAASRTGPTVITLATVNANVAGALGSGPLTLNSGTLNATGAIGVASIDNLGGTINAPAANAFSGVATYTMGAGALTLQDPASGSGTAFSLAGGTLTLLSTPVTDPSPSPGEDEPSIVPAPLDLLFPTGGVTVTGGNTTVVVDSSAGGSFPNGSLTLGGPITVSGAPTITGTNASKGFALNFGALQLASDLTLAGAAGTMRTQGGVTETGGARRLFKTGANRLVLNGPATYTGGTDISAGILQISVSDGAGVGPILLGATSGTTTSELRLDRDVVFTNALTVRGGGSGVRSLTRTADLTGTDPAVLGDITLQAPLTIANPNATGAPRPFLLSGRLSGAFALTLSGTSLPNTIRLTNAANDFGPGTNTAISLSFVTLAVPSDAALGATGNGLALANSALRAEASFSTARRMSFAGTSELETPTGVTLTLEGVLAGNGAFSKTGPGRLVLGAASDGTTSRPAAASNLLAEGVTEFRTPLALNNAAALVLGSSINTTTDAELQLLRDSDTTFGHNVVISTDKNAIIHVDRAPGGSGSNGRHTLGSITQTGAPILRITGANGYGLTTGTLTIGTAILENNAPGELRLGAFDAGSTFGNPTVRGTGTTTVAGAFSLTPGRTLTKDGLGTFRLGTSATAITTLQLRDGTFDANGLALSLGTLVIGGGGAGAQPVFAPGAGSLTTAALTLDATNPLPTINLPLAFNVTGTQVVTVADSPGAAPDLVLSGPLTGTGTLQKSGLGTLRLATPTAATPAVLVQGGPLELASANSGPIGLSSLTAQPLAGQPVTVTWLAPNQIADTAPLNLTTSNGSGLSSLQLNGFTETVGSLVLRAANPGSPALLRTGATGVLRLAGNATFTVDSPGSPANPRTVLLTGSGDFTTPATDGQLDLLGGTRTITVNASATVETGIETAVGNGALVKNGPGRLHLLNPANTFNGLTITQGDVVVGAAGALGATSSVLINPTGTQEARLVLSVPDLAIDVPVELPSTGGTGASGLGYDGPIGTAGIYSGPIALNRTLQVNVARGNVNNAGTAGLDVTGLINDGAGSFGVLKTGDGRARLALGNAFSGPTTIARGTLTISGDSALGDNPTAQINLGTGVLHADFTVSSVRPIVLTAAGHLRVDDNIIAEYAGPFTTNNHTLSAFGSGTIVLSGSGLGGTGGLTIGIFSVANFADATGLALFDVGGFGVLSVRGGVTLPGGQISIVAGWVLELGLGDMTRVYGTSSNQCSIPSGNGGGFAAFGADRVVSFGGLGSPATLVWGQKTSPRFLYDNGDNRDLTGPLVLGSSTATHTLRWRNPLNLDNGEAEFERTLLVVNGPAAVEARMEAPIFYNSTGLATLRCAINSNAVCEISGLLSGTFDLSKTRAGTLRLLAANTRTGSLGVEGGLLTVAAGASLGTVTFAQVLDGAELDISATGAPFATTAGGLAAIDGTVRGSVNALAGSTVAGFGLITADLTTTATSSVIASAGSQLFVDGSATLASGANYVVQLGDFTPPAEFVGLTVAGTVSLNGAVLQLNLNVLGNVTDEYTLIRKTSAGSIAGTFAGLPEGTQFFTPSGHQFQISYLGGDGNDVVVTLLTLPDTIPVIDTFGVVPGTGGEAGMNVASIAAHGRAGTSYTLQTSPNLQTWTNAQTLVADLDGSLPFRILQPPNLPKRFYRVVLP